MYSSFNRKKRRLKGQDRTGQEGRRRGEASNHFTNHHPTKRCLVIVVDPMRGLRKSSSIRTPALLHLLCAAAILSLFVFAIKSSFSAGIFFSYFTISLHLHPILLTPLFPLYLPGTNQQITKINTLDLRILSDFQSTLQQCVVSFPFPPHLAFISIHLYILHLRSALLTLASFLLLFNLMLPDLLIRPNLASQFPVK